MANLLQNMLTLQTNHRIPMRMDLSDKNLLTYYESQKRFDSPALLDEVIKDLKIKVDTEFARLIKAAEK